MTQIFLFPGQGSQKQGMGAELFDSYRDAEAIADEILGYSIRQVCLETPAARLNQTAYTQPALYVVNAMTYWRRLEERGHAPAYAAGHSLGEYNALLAADAFDFATGLKLVRRRGELMGKVSGGGMAAVVGFEPARIRDILDRNALGSLDMANFNTPLQTVISGPAEDIRRAGPIFEAAGVSVFMPLRVSGAFHSRYMEPVREAFRAFIAEMPLRRPRIPVIANRTAAPYGGSAAEVAENLVGQITSPVRWNQTMEFLLARENPVFTEAGPGNVLTGILKQITTAAARV